MPSPFRKVLFPVYFDETSPAALEYARHLARQGDGIIYLLHVVPTDELHLLRKIYRPEQGGGADTGRAGQVSREQMAVLARSHLQGLRYEILIRFNSDPSLGILE